MAGILNKDNERRFQTFLISAPNPLLKSLIGVHYSSIKRNVEQGLTNPDFRVFFDLSSKPTSQIVNRCSLFFNQKERRLAKF